MSGVEPLQKSNVIKTLCLKEGTRKGGERSSPISWEVVKKQFKKRRLRQKKMNKVHTLLSFPLSWHWRVCSGEASHSIYDTAQDRHTVGERLTLVYRAWQNPIKDRRRRKYTFCINNLYFPDISTTALTAFGFMSGYHHTTVMCFRRAYQFLKSFRDWTQLIRGTLQGWTPVALYRGNNAERTFVFSSTHICTSDRGLKAQMLQQYPPPPPHNSPRLTRRPCSNCCYKVTAEQRRCTFHRHVRMMYSTAAIRPLLFVSFWRKKFQHLLLWARVHALMRACTGNTYCCLKN